MPLQLRTVPEKIRLRAPRCRLTDILLACGLCLALPARADVFFYVAEDGSYHYSDQAEDARFHLVPGTDAPLAKPLAVAAQVAASAVPHRFEAEISAAARASGIEAALLHAVVRVESGYDAKSVSRRGALGLMQLMPKTALQYGVKDPFDAAQNLGGGARFLRDLLDLFGNNKELALAAYNAGPAAVIAHGRRIPPYPETMHYVPAILRGYDLLRRGASPAKGPEPGPASHPRT